MDFLKIIGIAVVTAVTVIILKNGKPELAFAATLTGIILILFAVLDMLRSFFSVFDDLVALTGVDDSVVRLLLKMVGIGYLTEFSCDLMNDFGISSMAGKVDVCGRIAVLLLALPIIRALIVLIGNFLNLLG